MREEEARAAQLVQERDKLQRTVNMLEAALRTRSRQHAAEKQELYSLRCHNKELNKRLNSLWEARKNAKFFQVEPILDHMRDLELKLESEEQQLKAQQELTSKLKATAEPPKSKFFDGGYTPDVDLLCIQLVSYLGVNANVVPRIWFAFAEFFGVTIPSREMKVCIGHNDEGRKVYEPKQCFFIPGVTDVKQLPAIGAELRNLQAAEWILEDPAANFCYMADGASLMQREKQAQLLFRRSKMSGKLESMALSIDQLHDESAEGGIQAYHNFLERCSAGWEALD